MKIKSLVFFFLFIFSLLSCKKESANPKDETDQDMSGLLKYDSLFLYAKQVYFWNEKLPSYENFNPRQYADEKYELQSLKNELFSLCNYSINPETQKSFEYNLYKPLSLKFSTIVEDNNTSKARSSVDEISASKGYGIAFISVEENDLRIEYVIPGSPAEKSGLRRGMRVLKVNGEVVKTNRAFYEYIKSAINLANINITIDDQKLKQEKTYGLIQTRFDGSPVAKSAVLESGGKKIGYLCYLMFNSPGGKNINLDQVFDQYIKEGVTDLVIDLRYNSGGLITASDYLANLIIPEVYNKKVLRREKYNKIMQENSATILQNQILTDDFGDPLYIGNRPATMADGDYSLKANTYLIDKKNGLKSLKKINFIVSNQSASASELLINSLRPYLNVKLIGVSNDGSSQIRTYGKPIGFFAIKINRYQVYYSMFQNLNANDEADYFNGMITDISVQDDARFDFGDPQDPALQVILHSINLPTLAEKKTQNLSSKSNSSFKRTELKDSKLVFSGMKKEYAHIKFKIK